MSSILSHFPGDPRQAQVDALTALERDWGLYNVFVVSAPVAVGKSRIAVTLAKWLAERGISSALTTPTNVLVQQYAEEFTELVKLGRRDSYSGQTDFGRARSAAMHSSTVLGNYFVYAANRLWKDVLICDEAHNVLPMLQDRWAHKLWQRDWHFPDDMVTVEDFVAWAETVPSDKLTGLVREVVMDQTYVLEFGEDMYRGRVEPLLKLKPLTVRNKKPWLWPSQVRKIVLLSATMSEWEVYELGLDRRRTAYIDVESPIPAANRPVVGLPVVNMAYANRDYAIDKLAAYLLQVLRTRRGKGMIHATYDVAARLRSRLSHERLIWHGRDDRSQQYLDFRSRPADSGAVMVACGMGEGIDLAYDAAGWQVVTAVPWLSLADPAVRTKAELQPEWYQWEAVKALLQVIGRVCRALDDYGLTEIVDAQFPHFYKRSRHLWPQHVQNSVRIKSVFDVNISVNV